MMKDVFLRTQEKIYGFAYAFVPHRHSQPALRFERATGLSDIGRKYVMPYGRSAAAIERSVCECVSRKAGYGFHIDNMREYFRKAVNNSIEGDDWQEQFKKLLDDIIELNSELKTVEYDRNDIDAVYHFILGTTSGFNPDDIEFWLREFDPTKLEEWHNKPEYLENGKINGIFLQEIHPDPEIAERTVDRLVRKERRDVKFIHWIPSMPTLQKIKEGLNLDIQP